MKEEKDLSSSFPISLHMSLLAQETTKHSCAISLSLPPGTLFRFAPLNEAEVPEGWS